MNVIILISAACALLAVAMGFLVLRKDRRSLAHISFVAGVLLLAIEGVFNALSLGSDSPEGIIVWQRWRMLTTGCCSA
jgi:hypothetical protein